MGTEVTCAIVLQAKLLTHLKTGVNIQTKPISWVGTKELLGKVLSLLLQEIQMVNVRTETALLVKAINSLSVPLAVLFEICSATVARKSRLVVE